MSDVRHDEHDTAVDVADGAARAASDERRDPRGPRRLGHVLRETREAAAMDVSDLAAMTHVRSAYLEALEEGRYAELPEDVYTRNFLRLYAQAVGLDVDAVVELYLRERRTAMGLTTLEQRLERDRRTARGVSSSPTSVAHARRGPPAWLLGPWLPTLVLVALVVAIGLWGFNQLFARTPGRTPTQATTPGTDTRAEGPPPAPAADGSGAPTAAEPAPTVGAPVDAATDAPGGLAAPTLTGPGQAASLSQVRVDVSTDPPGASVTIDGFPIPGRTPLSGIPVTGRDGRVVRAELDGYLPAEVTADLSADARVELSLTPIAAATEAVPSAPGTTAAREGRIVITVTDTTWLEVYRSTQRNVGERLVYTTAQDGATFAFEPPLYVYVGNAAGVRLTHDGQDLGAMGSPGAVLGRAFPE